MTRRGVLALITAWGLVAIVLKLANPISSNTKLTEPFLAAARAGFDNAGLVTIDNPAARFEIGVLRDECLFWVAVSERDGENDALFRQLHEADSDLWFDYAGERFEQRPSLRIFVDRIQSRFRSIAGQKGSPRLILALAASRACSSDARSEILSILKAVSLPDDAAN